MPTLGLFSVKSVVCFICNANCTIKSAVLHEPKFSKVIKRTNKTPFIWKELSSCAPELHITPSHPERAFHLENRARISAEYNIWKIGISANARSKTPSFSLYTFTCYPALPPNTDFVIGYCHGLWRLVWVFLKHQKESSNSGLQISIIFYPGRIPVAEA